jgi:hypothetical protein
LSRPHIISNNQQFVQIFESFNYQKGMIPKEVNSTKHESFFSKFMFALNKIYGKNKDLSLPILEDGADL